MSGEGFHDLGPFQTTHWSLVRRAGVGSDEAQRHALGELICRYAPALRSHLLKCWRVGPDEAEDLLQGFMLSRLVETDVIAVATPDRGRFRGYLCTMLDRFVSNEMRHQRAKKRSAEGTISVDQAIAVASPIPPAETVFAVAWAQQLLEDSVNRMRQHCLATGRSDLWGVFEGRLLGPLLNDARTVSYEELCRKYGVASPAQASNLLVTARRTFVRVLRCLIGEYEKDESQVDAEIADLIACLGRARE